MNLAYGGSDEGLVELARQYDNGGAATPLHLDNWVNDWVNKEINKLVICIAIYV